MKCEFCLNDFTNKTSLNTHQRSAKYCLKIQNVPNTGNFVCKICEKAFIRKSELLSHSKTCKRNPDIIEEELLSTHKELDNSKNLVEMLEKQVKEQKQTIKELQDKLENVAISAVSRHFEEHNTVDVVEEGDSNDDEEKEEYFLKDLEVSKGYTISHREEDGYINVTQLCAAGKKKFNDWNRLSKTKSFLQVLSTAAGIPAPALVQVGSGNKFRSTEGQATWVHPQVAINIAQWISPHFDVKVSTWVYEAMMTGKVDISNTKSYRELQKEVKDKDIKINLLTKKYVKKQPRLEITERNVVYILTTKSMKKDRRYILGKATNLTSRLSTYNKTDEHEIVYYQGCNDEDMMSIVETMVFNKLKKYREQANWERFVLPPDQDISLFVDTVKSCIEFTK